MAAQAVFDPVKYKETTRQQWQNAAEAWHRWGPAIESWLGAATEEMLTLAGVQPGSRVLDVAAGAGGQTLAAADGSARKAPCWRPTSPPTSSPTPRRKRAPPG